MSEPPEDSENIKENSRKINGKRQNCETFHEILANFDLKKLILIKIKAVLMEFWKALIILKEIKKPSDKILRVWAKNQLRFEIFEKILKFTYRNLNEKVIFYPFSLPSSRTFVILCTSATYLHLAVGWGGHVAPGLGGYFWFWGWGVGLGGLYKSLLLSYVNSRSCTSQIWTRKTSIFNFIKSIPINRFSSSFISCRMLASRWTSKRRKRN